MKTETYSSLGLELNLSVPTTVEEFDQNAKKQGACLAEATNNVVYRGMLASFRYHFLHGVSEKDLTDDKEHKVLKAGTKPIKGVEEVSGIDRKTIPVMKDGKQVVRDGQPVEAFDPEDSEAKYFKRVCAAKGVEASAFKSIADAVSTALVFDASATERAPAGPKKLAQKYKDVALQFLTGKKNLEKLQKAFAKDLNGKQFTPVVKDDAGKAVALDAEVNQVALGWLCKEWEAAQDQFKNM